MKKNHFSLVEIMIVVGILGILSVIAIPNFARSRKLVRAETCIANLRSVKYAKGQYAMDNNVAEGGAEPAEADIAPYIKGEEIPTCPIGNTAYTINPIGTNPTCPNDPGEGDEYRHLLP